MNKAVLNYEDVDKGLELEIFGLTFNVDFNEEYIKELKNVDVKSDNTDDEKSGFDKLAELLDKILGKDAFKKISDKYKTDKEKEMGLGVIIGVYNFIFKNYTEVIESLSIPKAPVQNNNNDYRRDNNYRNNNYRNDRNYRDDKYRRY
ncbi:MAG: hypothetical protein WC343_09240 [Bacilli bacterium]|jgi:hypothetical protein